MQASLHKLGATPIAAVARDTEGSPLSDLVRTLPDFSDADFDVSELKAH